MTSDLRPGFLAPRGTLAKKPAHGEPCNRCGLCCMATLCPLGRFIFGQEIGPCPALVRACAPGEQYGCGLVADPGRYRAGLTVAHGFDQMREAAALLIGSGTGCDARFNGEPANEAFYAQCAKIERSTRAQTRDAQRKWGVPR